MKAHQELKTFLLSTGYFIENTWLDNYLDLIINYDNSVKGYKEKHHSLPVAYYKQQYNCKSRNRAVKLADNDKNNFIIELLYKDHCLAHWYLYNCTTGKLKYANQEAILYIYDMYCKLENKIKTQEFNFNIVDLNYIQDIMDKLKNDPDSRFWTDEEIQFIKENYPKYGRKYCADYLDRTPDQVKSKALDLGIKADCYYATLWTEEELNYLKNNYATLGASGCMEYLNRTSGSIRGKAKELGIEFIRTDRWSKEDIQFLKENRSKMSLQELATALNKTKGGVASHIQKLGLQEVKDYTEEEKLFIQENYPKYGAAYVAEQLNRNPAAVKRWCSTHKIKGPSQGHQLYCPELDRYFKSIKAASNELGLSDGGICQVAQGKQESIKGLHFIRVKITDLEGNGGTDNGKG